MGVGIRRSFRALLAGSLVLGSVAVGSLAVESLPASASGPVLLYVSTSGSDGGGSNACTASTAPCLTIQQAINEAQNYPTADADDVIINVAAGTYTENDTVDASSLHSLTIAGAGASSTTVNGPVGSVFTVDSGVVTISGLTITGGHGEFGGAIDLDGGTLNVTDSTLSGNNGYQGGAIENFTGTLNVTDSTISGNTGSGYGGGIFDDGGGTVTVTDSTMSGNNGSSGGGGGIFIQNGTVTVTDSTISGNTGGSYGGGGIFINSGIAYVGGTILADNTGGNCGSNLLTSVGYNLTNDEGAQCGFTQPTDVVNANPGLGHLTNNGGPTLTQLPAANGPAVGVIPTGTTLDGVQVCPRTDQRGVQSVGDCTIGAVERSTLYVTQSGSGLDDCSTPANACSSIQTAITTATGGSYAGGDVTINVAAGTYSELDTINASSLDSLTITGAGSSTTAVTPPELFGTPLTVNSGTVTISGLTLENGGGTTVEGGDIINNGTLTLYSSTVSNGDGDIAGGGIYNTGTMTLDLSTVSGGNISHIGGGIYNAGTMTINSSTVSGNHGDEGGGIANAGTMTINSSTVSGNNAAFGGGIANAITDGGINGATLAVNSSTVSGNTAAERGGGINTYGGTVTSGASIVAANTGLNCYRSGGSFTSLGYDLTDDPSNANYCGFTASTDVLDAKPGLGHLTNNGGPTLTQLPAANGPAVGVIPAGTKLDGVKVCPRTDQRGVASIGKCTIGAVEQHGVWQSQVQGYPAFPVKDSPPPGFLIGVQDGIWKLYSHNLSGTDIFTGTITTNGTFSDVALTSNDSGDKMTMLNPQTISFGFHTAGYVSGIKFISSGSQVTFHNLEENGTLVPPADILLGSAETSATSNPLTITRP